MPQSPVTRDAELQQQMWQQAKTIFGAALERPSHAREGYVDEACGANVALREEVRSLLAEHAREGSFLRPPVAPLTGVDHADPIEVTESRVLAGRYAIQRVLGRGGMATVYLANDLRHPRAVAVKVLRRELAAPLGGARFLREIRITAGLVHPHILPLHDSGEADGLLYYVMPYVPGETLREHLTHAGRLSLDEALRIVREIADALAFAHARGVVHRDIKPENILLSDGHAVVADFGIGHAAGDTLTGTGFAVGTPAYMSPEQALGDRAIDGRADIYSLGCVLFEMLAGEPPFRGATSRAVMAQHQVAPPPSVRTSRGDVPPAVEQALLVALAKEPAQRFTTARQFADVLARAHGTGAGVPPDSQRVVAPRRRWSARTSAALLLLLTVVGALTWGLRPPSTPPLVTVALFHVASADPELQRWHYDLPLLIAGRLDGARPLRASTPAVGVGRQPEVADRAAAAALGRRTGAQYVVFGRVLRDRQGAVRVEAEVVDVAQEEVVDQVHATAASAARTDGILPEVTDSLTRALLTSFGASMPVAATRHAAFGCASSSWPAVSSYLRGEQHFRRTQWDSAVAAYQHAVALDSGCALAYHRIAVALGWQGYNGDSVVLAYKMKAGVHNHGLPPRDSLLVTADSLAAAAEYASDAPEVPASAYWPLVRRLLRTLEEAARRYPGDSEVSYALADARYHHAYGPARTTVPDILRAFDNAIRQDSGFALSYSHPMELAYLAGGRERAMRYVHGYLATRPTGVSGEGVRLVAALADPRTAYAPETLRRLVEDTLDVLITARNLVDRWPDSSQAAIRLTRVIAQRRGTDTLLVARCRGGFKPSVELAKRLAYRGRLREAACALGDSLGHRGADLFTELVALGGVPDTLAARVYDRWLERRHFLRGHALPWWAARGDAARLDAFIRGADSVLRSPSSSPVQREEADYDVAAGRAYGALARGDTTRALAGLAALPDTQCLKCFMPGRATRAVLLSARGDLVAARRALDEWRGPLEVPTDIRVDFDRGRLAERLGDREGAIARYRRVAQTWRGADAVLQPIVAAAERALRRLGAS